MYFNNFYNNFNQNSDSYPIKSSPIQQTINHEEHLISNSLMLQKILSEKSNYICFDCKCKIPELSYMDIKNAIFLCYSCFLNHQKYPKEISELISCNIRKLDGKYLMPLFLGGNKNLYNFIRNEFPLLEKKELINLYSTKALDYYRKFILSKINNEKAPYKPNQIEGYNSIFGSCDINYIGKKDWNEDNDIEMADVNCNNNESDINTNQDSGSENSNDKDEITENKNVKRNKEKMCKLEEINERCITVNQLGNIKLYPEAKAIDDMEC